MENKLVSIIVPCYNASKYLDDLFLSLKNQTYKNIEIVFVDDGSSDDTLLKLEAFAKTVSFKVNIVKQVNAGPSAARNTGLKEAKGEYICFSDADDICHPQLIEKLYQAIEETNADLACCRIKRILHSNHYKNKYLNYKNLKNINIAPTSHIVATLLSTSKIGYGPFSKLYRTDILKKLNGYPNVFDKTCYYGEDLLMNLQYCSLCKNVVYLNKRMYYYRFAQNSITTSKFNTKRLTFKKVVDYFYTLDQEQYKEAIPYIKTYLCFISADILLKISKSDFNDKEIIKSIYNDFRSNLKYCKKTKMSPWYRKYFMWVMVPICKCAISKKLK